MYGIMYEWNNVWMELWRHGVIKCHTVELVFLNSTTQAFIISNMANWTAVILGVICCRSSTTSGYGERDNLALTW